MKLKIKDQIPNTEIFQLIDGEPQKSKIREIIGNEKIVLFGLPGAFTSTCSKLHLPGFVANADKIKAKGIENIFCLSVNDPYVMSGWGEINNTGDKIKMLSDPYLLFTKAIGAEVDRNSKGMGIRSNRYLMVIENFTVINIHVEKETKECGLTSAESLLDNVIVKIKNFKKVLINLSEFAASLASKSTSLFNSSIECAFTQFQLISN